MCLYIPRQTSTINHNLLLIVSHSDDGEEVQRSFQSQPSAQHESARLPLVIKEKDVEYQFHRLVLFSRLLESYPYSRERIISEAIIDICPLVRGDVWAALLGVKVHDYGTVIIVWNVILGRNYFISIYRETFIGSTLTSTRIVRQQQIDRLMWTSLGVTSTMFFSRQRTDIGSSNVS